MDTSDKYLVIDKKKMDPLDTSDKYLVIVKKRWIQRISI